MSRKIIIYNILDTSSQEVEVQEDNPTLGTIAGLSGISLENYKVKPRNNKEVFIEWPDGRVDKDETMLFFNEKRF
jgi:hypothetical protein